jgi:hypothetical protein
MRCRKGGTLLSDRGFDEDCCFDEETSCPDLQFQIVDIDCRQL